ncbi:hypothetical protein GUITHDRAFT_121962 [Guillardia theta CCMP2712]|uniref:Uncharacterized protein n=1 Tax=Guillardia theta (strain CCMP2712) TaxID=905079 RepID=L1I7I9_GUITC|nr:hypothetical protein GUITHDRAFT_121962 [Guillardia theta CCMP2712]EKX31844.1 hypothetical protein GUITHDRAFT_121962 [Guillardia theta CCMP2712]|eukprot:XP_005818824.1 hypothetical protein GUITHDRAFT_121962 [Guillardia theta CCMP2712]
MSAAVTISSSPAELRRQWHHAEVTWKKHVQTEGLFTNGGMPSQFGNKLCNDVLAPSKIPSLHELVVEEPYASYGVCIKESGDRQTSLRVAGRTSSKLKPNSFVSSSLLDQDSFEIMGDYGDLAKAWRFACKSIQTQNPVVNVSLPFCCERVVTIGNTTDFHNVQHHKGAWTIIEGCDQGSQDPSRNRGVKGGFLPPGRNVLWVFGSAI